MNHMWERSLAYRLSEKRRLKLSGKKVVETTRIRCSGALHRISWTRLGPITTHNHSKAELAAMAMFQKMGDKQCQCLDMVKGMKTTYSQRREFKEFSTEAMGTSMNRSSRRLWRERFAADQKLKSESYTNRANVLQDARSEITSRFATALYKMAEVPGSEKGRAKFGEYATQLTVGFGAARPDLLWESTLSIDKKGVATGVAHMRVNLGLDYMQLRNRGLETVDGSIVLWASPPDGQDRVEVIAGRVAVDRLQGFRLSVRPWRAIAARGDDGAWHLKSWEYTDVIDIAGNPPPMEIPKVSFTGDVGSGFTETIR